MNVRTVNLDFYDDKGALLRDLVDDFTTIPEFVKKAHVMNGEEDSDLYALVLDNDGSIFKKFPTYDAGNTWISSSYFAENYEKLPEEAQKVAAANLKEACENFKIPVLSVIEKLAGYGKKKSNIVKAKKPKKKMKKHASDNYALNGKYPISTASEINSANRYFETYWNRFPPQDRRDYAVKVASAAAEHGMITGTMIQHYSSETINPSISEHLLMRKNYLATEPGDFEDAIDTLEKVASIASSIEPDVLAQNLMRFDKKNGLDKVWGRSVVDPYHAVFVKEASFGPEEHTKSVGATSVSASALKNLAKNKGLLISQFGVEFAEAFQNDPEAIFDSMPTPQKKILTNMANDSAGY